MPAPVLSRSSFTRLAEIVIAQLFGYAGAAKLSPQVDKMVMAQAAVASTSFLA
jgi:hypothetical protein